MKRKEIYLSSLVFSFMICVFAPLEIYLSNKGYFFFPGTNMLPSIFICFAVMTVISILVLLVSLFCGEKAYNVIYGMFTGGILGLYIQGNWDFTDYGAWNGDDLDWSPFTKQMIVFIIIWTMLFIGCVYFSLRKHERFVRFSNYIICFIGIILLFTVSVLQIKNNGLAKEKEYIATTDQELQLSEKANMIIIVADTFDGRAFYDLINENKTYSSAFDGFTFYRDAMGAYTSTDMSLPLIMSGSDYRNDILYGEYLNNAFSESKLVNWLTDNGWEKDLYTDMLVPQENDKIGISNLKKMRRISSDNKTLMGYIYRMVLFRYLPQPLKRYFTFFPDNLKGQLCAFDTEEYEVYTEDNLSFKAAIDDITASKNESVFQLIHIDGSHPPFYYNASLELCDVETTYEEECEGVLGLIVCFMEKMKKENVYDNTIILIMGDHGYYDMRQNPLLLVKAKNERHNLEVSETPVSFFDLQDAYIRLLEDKATSRDVFVDVVKENGSRIIRTVPWNTHLNYDTYSGRIREFASDLPAYCEDVLGFDGNEFYPLDEGGFK